MYNVYKTNFLFVRDYLPDQRKGRVAVGEGARWIFMLMRYGLWGGGGGGYVLVMRFWFQQQTREYSDWRWPLSCVYTVMMVFSAQLAAA
jgi:hypothetical protein